MMHFEDSEFQWVPMSSHELLYWLTRGGHIFRHRGRLIMRIWANKGKGKIRSIVYADECDAAPLIAKGQAEFVGVTLRLTETLQRRLAA